MAYKEKEYMRRLSLGQGSNALLILVAINLILYIVLRFMWAVYFMQYGKDQVDHYFYQNFFSLFVMPADLGQLASRPWTVLTHMFVHDSFWRLLGNMLWLWLFGYILQDLTGPRKLFPVFLYGALAGALVFILAFHYLPDLKGGLSSAVAMEASAGVLAIATAATTLAPGYRIFPMLKGGIPLWIITLVYLVVDLATIQAGQPGGQLSHATGALIGYLFIYSFRKGYDWGAWMNNVYDWLINLFNPEKPKKGKDIKEELFYKSSRDPYKKTPLVTEKRIDEILDKISQTGYHSLTDEEKELLKKASKEDF